MKKRIANFIVLGVLCTLIMACAIIICSQYHSIRYWKNRYDSAAEKWKPHPETIEVNGVEYTGQVYTDGVIYAIWANDTLFFAGDGAISGLENWLSMYTEDRKQIKRIVIADGISYIDDYQFDGGFLRPFVNLQEVQIQGDLEYVGKCAFYDNPALKKVTFAGTVEQFNENALRGLTEEQVEGANPPASAFLYNQDPKKNTKNDAPST